MSNEQEFYNTIVANLDFEVYDGCDPCLCLIGQTREALGRDDFNNMITNYRVASASQKIFRLAEDMFDCYDVDAALAMARDVLGLDETNDCH